MRPPDCLSVAAGLPTKLELEAAPQFQSYTPGIPKCKTLNKILLSKEYLIVN